MSFQLIGLPSEPFASLLQLSYLHNAKQMLFVQGKPCLRGEKTVTAIERYSPGGCLCGGVRYLIRGTLQGSSPAIARSAARPAGTMRP